MTQTKTVAAVTALLITTGGIAISDSATAADRNDKATTAKAKAAGKKDRRSARAARASRARASLVRVALAKRGATYRSGATGPNTFDCSGFTRYVYKRALGKNLPHYSGSQMSRTRRVSVRNLKPGDLLFYGRGGSQHVSMYIGKGKMIHATNPRRGVRVDSVRNPWYWSRLAGAGRLVQG